MKRCTKKYTQNANESVHSKLWRITLKFKSHGTDRYNFACQMVMMIHNFGHEKASLLNVLDCMTASSAKFLKISDNDSRRVAKRNHELIVGGSKKNTGINLNRDQVVQVKPMRLDVNLYLWQTQDNPLLYEYTM